MRLVVWSLGLATALSLVHCATGEDDPQRKKPGGVVDSGLDSGGTGGSGGADASGGSAGAELDASDASDAVDAALIDAVADATEDVEEAAADAADAATSGRLLMVARTPSAITFGQTSGGAWSTTSVSRATLSTPAVAAHAQGAVAVVRDQGDALSFATWDPQTSAWSAFAAVGAGGLTLGSPALAASGDVHLAYLGTDNKLYSNVYTHPAGWQNAFTPVQFGAAHSFGPSAPALAPSGSGVTLAQEGSDGNLYTQAWQAGWQAAVAHTLLVQLKSGTPPAAGWRASTSSVIVAYVETGTNKLLFIQGSAGSWSAPAPVHSSAMSASTPALCALANGEVVIAYRSLDDKVYASVMTGSGFSAPAVVHPSLGTTTTPALARGVGGHVAELAWVSGGSIQHSFLGASGWSGPTAVSAGGEIAVALATYVP